jgi:hypothetical protein
MLNLAKKEFNGLYSFIGSDTVLHIIYNKICEWGSLKRNEIDH